MEKDLFFEALNEYGKDFESIAHYINVKIRRQHTQDITLRTKDQIRLLYYQTFHKVSKYVRFSDGRN